MELAKDKAGDITEALLGKITSSRSGSIDGLRPGISSAASGRRVSFNVGFGNDPLDEERSKDRARVARELGRKKSMDDSLADKPAGVKMKKLGKTKDASTNTGPWRCSRCRRDKRKSASQKDESIEEEGGSGLDGLGEALSKSESVAGTAGSLFKGGSVLSGAGLIFNVVSALVVTSTSISSIALLGSLRSDLESIGNGTITVSLEGTALANQLQGIDNQLAAFGNMTNSIFDMLSQFSEITAMNRRLINQLGIPGRFSDFPITSCAQLKTLGSRPSSGFYWVQSGSGLPVRVFCDMTLACGNVTGGWMRVVQLDMGEVTSQCPQGFKLNETTFGASNSTQPTTSLRTCTVFSDDGPACSEVWYPVHNISYSAVCGRVIAYQFGAPDAFADKQNRFPGYVDGVFLTHDDRRGHIWTFAAAYDEANSIPGHTCPCIDGTMTNTGTPPAFIGDHYFCDTAVAMNPEPRLYAGDPLWDGSGCGTRSSCCLFNNPPWFLRHLPTATTDNIELAMCRDQARSEEDLGIRIVDIYVM